MRSFPRSRKPPASDGDDEDLLDLSAMDKEIRQMLLEAHKDDVMLHMDFFVWLLSHLLLSVSLTICTVNVDTN